MTNLKNIFSDLYFSRFIWILLFGFWVSCSSSASAVGLADLGLQNFPTDVGSRPQAMGKAFVGVANDENSGFYNPGGLPWSKGIMIYAKDFNNITAAQAYPTGYGTTIGISVVRTGISSFQAQTGQIADFSNNVLILSAAANFSAMPILNMLPQSQKIGIGANIKTILGQTLRLSGTFDRSAVGWELDSGILYKPLPWLSVGLNGQNIMPTGKDSANGGVVKWDNGDLEPVPVSINAGLSAKIIGDINSPIYLEGNELTINSDIKSQRDIAAQNSFGAEWNFRGLLFFRAGAYTTGTNFDSTCFGAGARFGGWGLDLASYSDFILKKKSITFSILYEPEEWTFIKKPETIKQEKFSISDPITNLSPSEESTTYEDNIIVSGKAKPGIKVSVNGQSVLLGTDGSFTAQVPLNPGKNLVLVELALGEEKESITRKVFRKPKIIFTGEARPSEELKTKVEALVTMGVVDVSQQAEFKLEAPVTRGELAGWLVKAANLPLPKISGAVFSDVPENHPLAVFIKASVDNNLMQAQGDKFYPDKPVSKAEAQEIFRKFGVIK